MTERVQCAECSEGYDSEEHPFCPRCGALATAAAPAAAVAIANRNDPRRRRVQAAGIILVSTGSLVAAFGLALLFMAGSLAGTMYSDGIQQESAPISVIVSDAGVPIAGFNVTVTSVGSDPVVNQTNVEGVASFAMQPDAVLDIQVGNWSGRLAAITLGSAEPFVLEIDVNEGPSTPIMDQGVAKTAVRTIGVLALLFALAPVVGGIMALRLRGAMVALVGAILGTVSWAFLFIATMSLAVLVVVALYVAAWVFLRQGKALFTS